jgi:hypothetical protein
MIARPFTAAAPRLARFAFRFDLFSAISITDRASLRAEMNVGSQPVNALKFQNSFESGAASLSPTYTLSTADSRASRRMAELITWRVVANVFPWLSRWTKSCALSRA